MMAKLDFIRLNPQIEFVLRKKDFTSSIKQKLQINSYLVWLNDYEKKNDFALEKKYSLNQFYDLKYEFDNNRALDPYYLKATFENDKDYNKLFAELNYNFSIKREKKFISIRLFAGTFLTHDDNNGINFQMSGVHGWQDYTYETTFLGRSEYDGFYSKQFTETDGGFKIYTPAGRNNHWLVSTNIKAKVPGIPIYFYVDLGTYYNAKNAFEGSRALMYDGGICIYAYRDIIEFYLPLFYSSDIKQIYEANNKDRFKEKLSFQFNLNLVKPFDKMRTMFE
jgi:hypothetical protein